MMHRKIYSRAILNGQKKGTVRFFFFFVFELLLHLCTVNLLSFARSTCLTPSRSQPSLPSYLLTNRSSLLNTSRRDGAIRFQLLRDFILVLLHRSILKLKYNLIFDIHCNIIYRCLSRFIMNQIAALRYQSKIDYTQ